MKGLDHVSTALSRQLKRSQDNLDTMWIETGMLQNRLAAVAIQMETERARIRLIRGLQADLEHFRSE